jgi:hypothetical protein
MLVEKDVGFRRDAAFFFFLAAFVVIERWLSFWAWSRLAILVDQTPVHA